MPKEDERKICQQCQIEIHTEVKTYNGNEKLSWRNPDGSPHYFFEESEKRFVHTPTQYGYLAVVLKEMNAKLDAILKVVQK